MPPKRRSGRKSSRTSGVRGLTSKAMNISQERAALISFVGVTAFIFFFTELGEQVKAKIYTPTDRKQTTD